MLERLAKGEQTVGELAAPYRMSLAAASKHIQTLERAGLVKRTVRGRIHYVRIDPRPLERADDSLRGYERLWDTRIERLVELLRHPEHAHDHGAEQEADHDQHDTPSSEHADSARRHANGLKYVQR